MSDLAGLFRRVWALGQAGVDVPLLINREGKTFELRVQVLRPPPLPQGAGAALSSRRRHSRQAKRSAGIQRRSATEIGVGFPLARSALAGMTAVPAVN